MELLTFQVGAVTCIASALDGRVTTVAQALNSLTSQVRQTGSRYFIWVDQEEGIVAVSFSGRMPSIDLCPGSFLGEVALGEETDCERKVVRYSANVLRELLEKLGGGDSAPHSRDILQIETQMCAHDDFVRTADDFASHGLNEE